MTTFGHVFFPSSSRNSVAPEGDAAIAWRQNNSFQVDFRDTFNMNGNGSVSAAGGRTVSAENDLSNHKFRIGDSVLYRSGTHGPGAASAVYKITQLLPSESDDCQYRIKSFDEPHERVVKESDLKRDL